jgi:hypothetical protein
MMSRLSPSTLDTGHITLPVRVYSFDPCICPILSQSFFSAKYRPVRTFMSRDVDDYAQLGGMIQTGTERRRCMLVTSGKNTGEARCGGARLR